MFAWRWLRDCYLRWEWKRRLSSYSIKLSISEFSRGWTKGRWGMESNVLYPPVALPLAHSAARWNRILSVGRFATTGHTKKQIELIHAFRELSAELPGWSYASVGGLNETAQDQAYYQRARQLGEESYVEVMANVGRGRLVELYQGSRIFWHAAGLGEDHTAEPEQAEHFGLTTVEAMSGGCVPLVINHGGQPEIVEHGVSGFVWNSLDQLKEYTRLLANDPPLQEKMAAAAMTRAEMFSRERCLERLMQFVGIDRA